MRRQIQIPLEQQFGVNANVTRSQFEKSKLFRGQNQEWEKGDLGQTVLSPQKNKEPEEESSKTTGLDQFEKQSTTYERLSRYGQLLGFVKEYYLTGSETAQQLVSRMLLYELYTSNERKIVLLNPGVRTFGASTGSHPLDKTVLVMEFAHEYVSDTANHNWEMVARKYFQQTCRGAVELISLMRMDPTWIISLLETGIQRFVFGRELLIQCKKLFSEYKEMQIDLSLYAKKVAGITDRRMLRLEYSEELSEALEVMMEDEGEEDLDYREAAARIGQLIGPALEVDQFWTATPIQILLGLLLEDDNSMSHQPRPRNLRRTILLNPDFRVCGAYLLPKDDRHYQMKFLLCQEFIPRTNPQYHRLVQQHFTAARREIISIINGMRADINRLIIAAKQRQDNYVGSSYTTEGYWPRSHIEGPEALQSLIRELESLKRRDVLFLKEMKESKELCASAREHSLQMSELDFLGHQRQDPVFDSADTHMNKYTKVIGQCQEIVSPLMLKLEELVWELLISDGDMRRASRRFILNGEFSWIGVGIASHRRSQSVITLMGAERLEESDNFAVRPAAMLKISRVEDQRL